MIVDILHPAAVRFVPARGRNPRTDLAVLRTPVELREIPRDELEFPDLALADHARDPVKVWRRGTECWQEISDWVSDIDAFAAFLEGRENNTSFERRFMGTPICARVRSASLECFSYRPQGHRPIRGVDVDRAKEILHDARPRAPTALKAWLDAEIAVSEGSVLTRYRPLAVGKPGTPFSPKPWVTVHLSGWIDLFSKLPASPATYRAMIDLVHASTHGGPRWHGPDPAVADWERAGLGDYGGYEHRLLVDSHAGSARRLLELAALADDHSFEKPYRAEELRAAAEGLQGLEADAMTGLAGLGDVRLGLLAIRSALELVGPDYAYGRDDPPGILREAIERLYLPSLPEPPIPDEDAAALVHAP